MAEGVSIRERVEERGREGRLGGSGEYGTDIEAIGWNVERRRMVRRMQGRDIRQKGR